MGCGASTVALAVPQSPPAEATLTSSGSSNSLNNNNNNNNNNKITSDHSKLVANGKVASLPNGGGHIRSFTGVYGGFRNNSVAPAPFPLQQNVTNTSSSVKKHPVRVPSEEELSAIEEVILEQHRNTLKRKNQPSHSLRPLSSIEESPNYLVEDLPANGVELSSIGASRQASVATQTETRSPASVVRVKSTKTQTDHDLFPEDELEVLLSRTDSRLVDISSSLYSSPSDELASETIAPGHKTNLIKRLNQSHRMTPAPVASFISSSVLVQNKRGSCDAIVQVKFICTFDQSIQTVLSLIAPSKNVQDDVNSIHHHPSLDSSASISPAITPSPEPIEKSSQDIRQLARAATIDYTSLAQDDCDQITTLQEPTVNTGQANDGARQVDDNEQSSDATSAKDDASSASSVKSESKSKERKLSVSACHESIHYTSINVDEEQIVHETVEVTGDVENIVPNSPVKDVHSEEDQVDECPLQVETMSQVASDEKADNCMIERMKSETDELDCSVNCKSHEINSIESAGDVMMIHSPVTGGTSVHDTLRGTNSQQSNKEPADKCSSGHHVNQSPVTVGEPVNFAKNTSVERRDASVQAGSPNAPAGPDRQESVLLTVPRPPACKKKQMIPSIQVFKEIDQRIIFESQEEIEEAGEEGAGKSSSFASSDQLSSGSDTRSTIHSLSKYLCRDLGNDLFKVRAIYRWITYNITYDGKCGHESGFLDRLVSTRLADCVGYCALFIEMCRALGITAVQVSGFAKGFDYRPGHWFHPGHDTLHSWCAVTLFGSWRLVDVTWGAGYVDHSGIFNRKFSEFYFLPDPEELIWTHFPIEAPSNRYTSETWQLIDQPITLEEFNSLPKVTPYFFACNLKLRSKLGNKETLGCIEFRIQTELKMQSHEPLRYKYKLYPTDQLENTSMNHFVFCTLKEDRTVGSFTIIPPSEGRYCFKIFASPEKEMLQGSTSLHLVAIFLLNCTRARKYLQPFPLNELPWGLTQAFYDFKLRFVSTNQTGPIIATWGGKRKVAIESPDLLLISHQLFDSDGCELDVRSSILREETVNKDNSMRICFTIAPPRIGTFKLSIFGMPRPKQKGKWRLPLLATFLIDCKLVKGGPTDEDPPLSETVFRSNSSKVDVINSTTSSSPPSINPQASTSN